MSEDIPLPLKPRAPKAYRKRGNKGLAVGYDPPNPDVLSVKGWCNSDYKYFSQHAGVAIKEKSIQKLYKYKCIK